MTEKYGTIPKKFTKAWWSYFWYYYKWHTLTAIFAVIMVICTIYGIVTRKEYDLTLTYAGKIPFPDAQAQEITDLLSPLCEDIDKNGEKALLFTPLQIDFNSRDVEYLSAMSTKLQVAFTEDNAFIFILDSTLAEMYAERDAESCVFTPLEDWLTKDIGDREVFSAHGINYGISVDNLKIFKNVESDLSDYYLFIRRYPPKNKIDRQLAGYKAAVKLANEILKDAAK